MHEITILINIETKLCSAEWLYCHAFALLCLGHAMLVNVSASCCFEIEVTIFRIFR